MRDCIIVLGMHRSGTSAVAGALCHLGVDFGNRLIPPVKGDNERGFWEDRDIRDCHEALLTRLGYTWDDIRLLPDQWWKQDNVLQYRKELTRHLRAKFLHSALWGVKDPRICRLIPLWIEILNDLDISPRFLLVFRHPVEVAASLSKRNGFSETKSALLWLYHCLAAEKWSRGHPRCFVKFADFLKQPWQTLKIIASSLSLSWPNSRARYEVEEYVDPRLPHMCGFKQTGGKCALPWSPTLTQRAYDALATAANSGNSPQSDMDEIERNCRETMPVHDPLLLEHIADLQSAYAASQTRSLSGAKWAINQQTSAQILYERLTSARTRLIKFPASPLRNLLHLSLRKLLGHMSFLKPDSRPRLPEIRLTNTLEFEEHSNPQVSIIIPVFNEWKRTQKCLASICGARTNASYEVIVVDDCSSDQTPRAMESIQGITTLTNESNMGFVKSCNRGAKQANGGYLVFLNNDTQVCSGWLDALKITFSEVPDAGLVGAKLVYPDGRLQEAGAIIRSDGTGWNYGRNDDPMLPRYNFLREVDYCSGACIMVDSALFNGLGGFDTRYAPAYYEDVDLAFRIRDAGRKTCYQPTAVVVHDEGASCGTDVSSMVKRYQSINKDKFIRRWKHALSACTSPGTDPNVAVNIGVSSRILVIDSRIPTPDRDAGSLRLAGMMKILCGLSCRITLAAHDLIRVDPYAEDLQRNGIEVLCAPYIRSIEHHLVHHGRIYDIVVLVRAGIANAYLDKVRTYCPTAKIVFDTVDLQFLREKRAAEVLGGVSLAEQAEATMRKELDAVAGSDKIVTVSESEKRTLEREVPGADVEVVGLILDVKGRRVSFEDRKDIVFIGGFRHLPNQDAVRFFADKIFPEIRDELRGVKFYVIGSDAGEDIRALACNDIIVTGHVENIDPYFNSCRLSVAPLRFGAGIKGKISTSLSYGLPVVATPLSCEGMDIRHGAQVQIAAEPDDFAQSVIKLYRDQQLWYSLSDAGLEYVRKNCSAEAAEHGIAAILHAENDHLRRVQSRFLPLCTANS